MWIIISEEWLTGSTELTTIRGIRVRNSLLLQKKSKSIQTITAIEILKIKASFSELELALVDFDDVF